MNFREIAETLAHNTSLTAAQVVMVAGLLATPETIIVDLTTPEARAQFAKGLPEAAQAINDGKRIVAIKAVREASKGAGFIRPGDTTVLGLKDAKDAVDAAFPPVLTQRCGFCNDLLSLSSDSWACPRNHHNHGRR